MESRIARIGAYIAVLALIPLILAPLAFLLYGSTLDTQSIIGRDAHITFRHFAEIATQPSYWKHFGNSVLLAACTGLGATVVGVFIAWVISRVRPRGHTILDVLMIVPFFLSSFIATMAWARLGNPNNGLLNLWLSSLLGTEIAPINVYSWSGIVFVMVTVTVPFVYMLTSSTLQSVDPALEEAGSMSGAGRMRRLLDITFPLVAPSILGGAFLAVIFALEAFAEPAILGSPAGLSFVTTDIYLAVKNYPARFGTASALAVALMLLTMILIYAQGRLIGHRSFVAFGGKVGSANALDQSMGRVAYILSVGFVTAYVAVAVLLPYLALLLISLQPYTSTRFGNWTLENYRFVLGEGGVVTAFTNSLLTGLIAGLISMAWMFALAYLTSRQKFRGRELASYVATIPVAVPGIVFGVALLWMWLRAPISIYGTLLLLVIAYIVRFSPYVFRSVSAAITQVDKSLEESARMSGAGPLRILYQIVFPLIRPSLLSGGLIFGLFAMRDLNASILLSTPGSRGTLGRDFRSLGERAGAPRRGRGHRADGDPAALVRPRPVLRKPAAGCRFAAATGSGMGRRSWQYLRLIRAAIEDRCLARREVLVDTDQNTQHQEPRLENSGARGAFVRVEGISKTYVSGGERIAALRKTDLLVGRGELVTLLGPSGCGKTTMLRCIAGLEQPDTGRILVDGKVVADAAAGRFVPSEHRQMGMVFQSTLSGPICELPRMSAIR